MDKIQKLLKKISRKDRERLLEIIDKLAGRKYSSLDAKKIINSDLYRLRSGRFRVIFHKDDKTRDVIIDSIKLRNEKTYK